MKNKITSIFAVIAVMMVLIALVLLMFGEDNTKGKDASQLNVPSPNQLMYGIKYDRELTNDVDVMKSNILSDVTYSDYDLKERYRMIYQIYDEASEAEVCGYIGIDQEELPTVDYSKRYLMVSVGTPVSDIKRIAISTESETKEDLLEITYSSSDYSAGKVYVYTMTCTRILSGQALDRYYWEKASEYSNFVESDNSQKTVASEGNYYKAYLRSDSLYEYVLMNVDGKTVSRKIISGVPDIKEISNTLIRVGYSNSTVYFNAVKGIVSEEYTFNTQHLIYDIITYMRVHDGETQLILRDAYDSTHYAKIVKLPFAEAASGDLDSLVSGITVVDDTHIKVEYLNSDSKVVTELVNVYNLDRY